MSTNKVIAGVGAAITLIKNLQDPKRRNERKKMRIDRKDYKKRLQLKREGYIDPVVFLNWVKKETTLGDYEKRTIVNAINGYRMIQ